MTRCTSSTAGVVTVLACVRASPRCSTASSARAAAAVTDTPIGATARPASVPPKLTVQSPALPLTLMPAPAVPVAARSAACTWAAVAAPPSAAVVTRPAPMSSDKVKVKVSCAPAGACSRCCVAVFSTTGVTAWA